MDQAKKQWIQLADMDYADTLTPYGVSIRYPNELFLEERHAKSALQMAKEYVIRQSRGHTSQYNPLLYFRLFVLLDTCRAVRGLPVLKRKP